MFIASNRRLFSGPGVIALILAFVLTTPAFALRSATPGGDPDAPSADSKAEQKDDPAARAEWFMRGRRLKGENSALLLQRAFQQKMKMRKAAQQRAQQLAQASSPTSTTSSAQPTSGATNSAPLNIGPTWQNIGPAPISGLGSFGNANGRITSVTVDQTDATGNTVFVSGAYGGVWKSTNAAASDPNSVTWTPLYDSDPVAATLATGAVALQPGNSNLILVGTGEPNNAGDSYYGMGILRSSDGGSSWTLITSGDGGTHSFRGMGVSKIAWKSDGSVVVAAFSNATISPGIFAQTSGAYYSTDAGATWQLASNPNGWGDVTDVVFNPTAGKFFAFVVNTGVASSTNGINWTPLAAQPGAAGGALRGEIAVRPGANETYVTWVNGSSTLGGIFRSLDGGATWNTVTVTGISSCGDGTGCGGYQGFYNLYLIAAPNGPSNTDLYYGAGNIFKCTLATTGTTNLCNATTGANNIFLNLTHVYGTCDPSYTSVHPDQHAADFSVAHPNIVYFGNDGGAYRTLTAQPSGMSSGTCGSPAASNAFQDLNTPSLGSLSQFISFSQHPTKPDILLGGTQDNGSPGFSTVDGQTVGTEGYEANGGDGGFNAIDQTNPVNWYTTFTDVSIQKCVGGTNQSPNFPGADPESACLRNDFFNSVVSNGQVGNDHGDFYTPYLLDPYDQSKMIVGTCRIWRGTPSGANLTAISSRLVGTTTPCPNFGDHFTILLAGGPQVNGVASVIYAGSGSGRIFASTTAGNATPSWADRTGTINPGAFPVSGFAIDSTDLTGQTAFVALMGFSGNPNGAGHLFKTTNAGQAWTDIGIGLPDAPADAVIVDPRDHNILYVATDVGVFVSSTGGSANSWQEYGNELPNVTAVGLLIYNHGGIQKLRVATHGRGIWQTDLLNANDYSLTSQNPIVAVRPGQTAHFAASAIRGGSFSATVALSCVPDPPATGTSCGITPSSADLVNNNSVPLAIDVPTNGATTPIGDHVFNLHGDGGSITHDLALTLRVNDFTVGSSTTQQTISQTGTATYAVTVTPQGNFSDPVTLSCANFTSAGLSCSFSPNIFAPGTSPVNVTVTLTAAANATLGAGTLDVVGTSGSTTPSVSLSYNVTLVQDFTFTGGTTSQTVLAGNDGNFSGTLTPLNSFSATNMTLGCTGLPAGGACNFTPGAPSISGGTPQPLAINVTNPGTTTAGAYNITATATDAVSGKTHNIPLTLNVGNFTLAASPSTRTIAPGAGTTYTVSVTAQNGYAGLITLACNAPPANATCSFSPAAVNPGTPSTLTVLTTSSITTGSKTISVTGTAEGQTRTAASVNLSISSTTPSFTVTVSPASQGVNLGASTTYTLNVKATIATSPGTVTMSCVAPLPIGVTCPGFSPLSFTPTTAGTNVSATVQSSNSTPLADQTVIFQPASSALLRQVNATLRVQDFTLGVSPSSQTIAIPGGSTQYTVTLIGINGFATAANLSCTGLPAGWSCGFAPASVTPNGGGAASTLTLTTTATPFGPTNFTVQAVSGSLTHSQLISVNNGSNDYQLSTAQALVAVRPGQTANYSVSLSRFGTFSALVNESCVPNPPATGTACSITPNPADLTTATCPANGLCTTAALGVSTNSGTTAIGDYNFNLHANGGSSQHDLPLTLRVNDFSIASVTPSQTIQQTGTGAYTVTVTGLNSWTAPVTLSCPPANFTTTGLSCSFSQNNFVPAAAGTNVTVTVTATGSAQIAAGTFDVVATDGATSHSVTRNYNVTAIQDFTYGNSTGQQAVLPGQTANYATTLTPLNGFAANVNLSCTGLPAGASCNFSPVSPVAIGAATPKPVTVSIVTTGTTPAADSIVTATATDPVSGKTHSVNLSLRVQSFTLSVSPTTRTIPPGSGTTFSVTVNPQNGLTLPVFLSCVSPPAGLTCLPPDSGVPPGATATMYVTSLGSITTGAKTLTISGTTNFGVPVVNQNVTVNVSSTTPSFTITNSTSTKVVSLGGSTSFSLSVKSSTTTSPGSVTMSCVPPLPTGVSCSFNPATFTPTTTARTVTATVSTTSSTPPQSFGLQFQVASTSQFRRVSGTLQVADYTLGVSPSTRTISSASGGTASYTATLTAIDGFNTATALSCTGLPAGWSCGFAPSSVTPTGGGATSTLTLTTTGAPLGPQNFTISATGAGITHTQTVEVINGQDFTISAATPITVNRNSSNTTSLGVSAIGTFAASVALSCSSLPPGFSCGFVPNSINPGTPSTLTISADNTVSGGQYTVAVQGQSSSPSLSHTTDVTVNVPDFSVSLTGGSSTVMRGANLPLNGLATAVGGFSASVTFTCSTGNVNVPCVAASPVTPTNGGAAVAVTVSPNGSATATSYNVTLTGNDGAGHTHTSAPFGINVQDFSVAATDANLSVEAGAASGSYSGSVTGLNFSGNVVLTCSSPSIGVACAFSPSSNLAASGGGTGYAFTITPNSGATVGGPYVVTITATVGSVTRTATVHITVLASQDWSYSYQIATPQAQTVNAGQGASYNINLSPNNGFNSSVALTCSVTGAPAGVGCGITGSPLTPPGAITLNVTTTNNTVATGTYSIVVSGTGGGKTRTTTASLTVRDFSLNVTPSTQTVNAGTNADYTVSTATTSAFPNSAALTCAVLTAPAGTGCSFVASPLVPGDSTTMHVTSTGSTPSGNYTVQVTATSGVTVHTFNVGYVVNATNPNDFTITTSTPSRTTTHPAFTTYAITVTATGTFAESVSLTCTNLPAGVLCGSLASFVPSTSGTAKSVAVSIGSGATPGTYSFEIKGTSATKTHSVPVQLVIN